MDGIPGPSMASLSSADRRDGDLRRFAVLFAHAERFGDGPHVGTFRCGWMSGKKILVQEPKDAIGGQLLAKKLKMHQQLRHEAIATWSEVRGWTVADYEELPTLDAFLEGAPAAPIRRGLVQQLVSATDHMVERGVIPTWWEEALIQVSGTGQLRIMELGGSYYEVDKLTREECDAAARSLRALLDRVFPGWEADAEVNSAVKSAWLNQYRALHGQDGIYAINGGNLYRRLWAGGRSEMRAS